MSYTVPNYKVGEPDKNGDTIKRVFHKKFPKNNDSLEFIIYETEDERLGFEGKNRYNERLGNYEIEIGEILNLIEILEIREDNTTIIKKGTTPEGIRQRYNYQFAAVIKEAVISEDDNIDKVKKHFLKLNAKINNHMFSSVKSEYLERCLYITSASVIIILLFWFWESWIIPFFESDWTFDKLFSQMLYVGAAGIIGGFISVHIKIEDIEINPHLPYQRTKLDANIRMFLSFFFAVLFFWFLRSGFFSLIQQDQLKFDTLESILLCLSVGVLGGFSERIVPSMLQSKEEEYLKKIDPGDKNPNFLTPSSYQAVVKERQIDDKEHGPNSNNVIAVKQDAKHVKNIKKSHKLGEFSTKNLDNHSMNPYPVRIKDPEYVIIQIFGGDDINLSAMVNKELEEYIKGLRGNVSVLALCDYYKEGAKIIEYHPRLNVNGSVDFDFLVLQELGEINITNPQILGEFISRALVTYNTSNYVALGFWGHGTGVVNDDFTETPITEISFKRFAKTSNVDALFFGSNFQNKLIIDMDHNLGKSSTIPSEQSGLTNFWVKKVLEYAITASGFNRKLNMIFLDSCLNGMIEVVTQLTDFCDVIMASEAKEKIRGWNYEYWSRLMSEIPPQNSIQWGEQALKSYELAYYDRPNKYHTIAIINTENIKNLNTAIEELVTSLKTSDISEFSMLKRAFRKAEKYSDKIRDLKQVAEFLREEQVSVTTKNACTTVIRVLDEVIHDKVALGKKVQNANGLSIFCPRGQKEAKDMYIYYKDLEFEKRTGWLDYLAKNY